MMVWSDRLPLPISPHYLFAAHSSFAKWMAKEKGTQQNSLSTPSILCALGSTQRNEAENAC